MRSLLVALLLASASFGQAIRVNVGGPQFTDSGGNVWNADFDFSGGSTYTSHVPATSIANTSDPTLYMTGRTDASAFSYAFDVVDGIYHVVLKFADTLGTTSGQRIFTVLINGKVYLSQFDIVRLAGTNAAYDRSFDVPILGNSPLTIIFAQVSGAPILSAIEIDYLSAIPSGTSLPTTCTIGQVFFKTNATAGQNLYGCTSVNTWTLEAGGGGGGTGNIDFRQDNVNYATGSIYDISTGFGITPLGTNPGGTIARMSLSLNEATATSNRDLQSGKHLYCRSTSGNDTYVCTTDPTFASYTRGMCLILDPDTTNTGVATINANTVGVVSILNKGGALSNGDIVANKPQWICYDGTQFIRL